MLQLPGPTRRALMSAVTMQDTPGTRQARTRHTSLPPAWPCSGSMRAATPRGRGARGPPWFPLQPVTELLSPTWPPAACTGRRWVPHGQPLVLRAEKQSCGRGLCDGGQWVPSLLTPKWQPWHLSSLMAAEDTSASGWSSRDPQGSSKPRGKVWAAWAALCSQASRNPGHSNGRAGHKWPRTTGTAGKVS